MPNFRRGVATPAERAELTLRGIADRAHQDLMAWRRSVLWLAALSLLIAAALSFTSHRVAWTAGRLFSENGHLLRMTLSLVASAVAVIGIVGAGVAWTRLRRWRTVLLIGASIYFAEPFLVACVPAKWMLRSDGLVGIEQVDYVVMISLSLLVPVYSLLAGLSRGARIVKEAMPGSAGAGLVLVLLVPINIAAIGCFGLVTAHMAHGWGVPIASIGALIGQVPYLLRAAVVVAPSTRESYDRHLRSVGWMRTLGLLMMVGGFAWALATTTIDGRPLMGEPSSNPWMNWESISRIGFRLAASYLVLLAAFCDLVDLAANASAQSIDGKGGAS